jgi:hypothetical protein
VMGKQDAGGKQEQQRERSDELLHGVVLDLISCRLFRCNVMLWQAYSALGEQATGHTEA